MDALEVCLRSDLHSVCASVQSLAAQSLMVSMNITEEQMHWLLLEEHPVAVMALPIQVPCCYGQSRAKFTGKYKHLQHSHRAFLLPLPLQERERQI